MNVKSVLKKNKFIYYIWKQYKIRKNFNYDEIEFKKYYIDSAKKNNDFRYSILLLVHSIEKGLCTPNPKPFGYKKVTELINYLNLTKNTDSFEYKIGCSILYSWKEFNDSNNWKKVKEYENVVNFLEDKIIKLKTGSKIYEPYKCKNKNFENVVLSRHSVRDYKDERIKQEDIKYAIKYFLESPSTCNRQMCRIIYIESKILKKELDKVILGIHGFNKKNTNYFVITYDLAALAYYGERQQGMFNAGLCTMNFINALHYLNIGSCCLQWSNDKKEDIKIRKMMNLNNSERIAVVIGAGYYLENNIIPCSARKKIEDVYSII